MFIINEAKYKKLPVDMQKVLDQAGKGAGENYCHYMDTQEAKEKQALTGIQNIELSPTEVARWKVLLDATKRDWAKRMDDRGKAGSEALAVWDTEMSKVRAAK